MSSRTWTILIVILAIVIAVLAWLLFATPVSAPTIPAATTTESTTSQTTATDSTSSPQAAPLDTQVTVTTPQPGATVGRTFTVAGTAPGAWFFEAQFPIQVRDATDDTIASNPAQAQGDWETSGLVTFTDTITIDSSYTGPATLILLRDNPSGLPQNDDSVTIPITVQ